MEIVGIDYGKFERISSLNPDFQEGRDRIKITLRIPEAAHLPPPLQLVETLAGFLPSLSSHRCCGENSLQQTFFERGERQRCAMKEKDPGVDMAHLVEHVLIDVQHFIARMRICSGVTCAYSSPLDLYDIFVESPEEAVGRVSALLAISLVADLLEGFRPDPRYLCVMGLARLARDNAGAPVALRSRPLLEAWGREQVEQGISYLHELGFLSECPSAFNFSGRPLLTYAGGS
jgi:hypothetical protein